MKKRLLCLLFALFLLIGLTACNNVPPASTDDPAPTGGEQGGAPEQLALPVYSGATFHPALGKNSTNATFAPLLYEGLFTLDESFTAQHCLCRSYERSGDGLTWRFALRPNVAWSDGTALTAQDVADALNTARGSGSRYANRLAGVRSVTAEGEDTVEVVLSAPNGNLPALLDIPLAKGTGERPPGTGPYQLVDGDAGLVLTLRQSWWQSGEKNYTQRDIALFEVSSPDDLLYAFDTREIGLVTTDFTGTDALGYSSDYAVWDYDTTHMVYLGFRCTGGPCGRREVRAAISKAIDREGLVRSSFAGHAKAALLPASPVSPLYDETAAAAEDGGRALSDLKDSLSGQELTLLVCGENTFKAGAAERIAETLRGYGVAVKVETADYDGYLSALRAGRFDLYLAEVAMTADFDLTMLVGAGGSLNYGGYAGAGTGPLLTAFRTADESGRGSAAAALYKELAEDAPIAPLCFKTESVLTQWGRMKGLAPVAGNVFYQMENWTF